jgi:predicted esterase
MKNIFFIFFLLITPSLQSAFCGELDDFVPLDLRKCKLGDFTLPCKDEFSSVEMESLTRQAKPGAILSFLNDDTLILFASVKKEQIDHYGRPYICCEIQAYLDLIGEDVYGVKVRWSRIGEAALSLKFLNVNDPSLIFKLNGSKFILANLELNDSLFQDHGMVASTHSLPFLTETRDVTIVKGRACRNKIDSCFMIYMPDGESTKVLVKNALERDIDLSNFVFVGIHNSGINTASTRIKELLFGYNYSNYEYFMRFVTINVVGLAESGQRPFRRISAGFSNGGAWALDAVLTNPKIFESAISMSPAEWKFRNEMIVPKNKIFIGAGLMESRLYPHAIKIVDELTVHKARIKTIFIPSGHGLNTWVNIFNDSLIELKKSAND